MAARTTADTPVCVDRLLLAADLQDLIAHRVTAMEVQAAAARRLLSSAPAAAADALAAVLRLGHDAMAELGRLGRLLDDGTPAAMHPTPTLQSLEGVAGARVDAGDADVPAGVALCAVRAVELLIRTDPAGHGVNVRVVGEIVRIECGWAPLPRELVRLRTVARPCGGRVTLPAAARCHVDLPFAP